MIGEDNAFPGIGGVEYDGVERLPAILRDGGFPVVDGASEVKCEGTETWRDRAEHGRIGS